MCTKSNLRRAPSYKVPTTTCVTGLAIPTVRVAFLLIFTNAIDIFKAHCVRIPGLKNQILTINKDLIKCLCNCIDIVNRHV